jgi:predicted amidohydrolase YtcJ
VAHTLFRGTIRTGDSNSPTAWAVTVRDGVITGVDDQALAQARDGGDCEQIDVSGALLPSFADGHCHPLFGGLEAEGPAITDAGSVQEILNAVKTWADEHPDEPWVRGGSYEAALAPRGEFDARWLDSVVPDRPVALRASDYHTLWCNSAALRLAGIGRDTPDPDLGVIVKRPDGEPLGTLREWHACDLVLDAQPAYPPETLQAALLRAGRRMAAAGVTWWQDAWVDPGSGVVDAYLAVAETLPVRADLALRADPDRWRDQVVEFARIRDRLAAAPTAELVSASTVKFFADGVIEGGTAALLDAYADGSGVPTDRGMPVWEPALLAEAAVAFSRAGFGLHLHAIGDAAIRSALDAIARAIEMTGPLPKPPVIAHCQLIDAADIPRFAALGVIANLEPLWLCLEPGMTELTLPRLGDRGDLQYPLADLLASGATVSFGSDWPISSEVPLAGIATAVTRQTDTGQPPGGWTPWQRISLTQALHAYSGGVAAQAGQPHVWGRIAAGMRADLVLLEADPHEVAAADLAGIAVLGTWAAGRRTHGS